VTRVHALFVHSAVQGWLHHVVHGAVHVSVHGVQTNVEGIVQVPVQLAVHP
jgi:hypothetical protein